MLLAAWSIDGEFDTLIANLSQQWELLLPATAREGLDLPINWGE
jgi:hypothetical protein